MGGALGGGQEGPGSHGGLWALGDFSAPGQEGEAWPLCRLHPLQGSFPPTHEPLTHVVLTADHLAAQVGRCTCHTELEETEDKQHTRNRHSGGLEPEPGAVRSAGLGVPSVALPWAISVALRKPPNLVSALWGQWDSLGLCDSQGVCTRTGTLTLATVLL